MTAPEDARAQCHRFFFALKPDAETAARTIAFAAGQLGTKGLVRPERLHVTLALTDDHPAPPADLMAALVRAGAAVKAEAFDLPLTRLVGEGHVAWIAPDEPPPPLMSLQAAVIAAMAAQGMHPRADWQFVPHETLAYRKGAYRKGAYRKGERFERTVADQGWRADALYLIHSHVGIGRHDVLGHWPLG
jgi:2'-5' RNA ligase